MKRCHSGPGFHRGKLQPESSVFRGSLDAPVSSTGQAPQVRHDGLTDFVDRRYLDDRHL